MTEKAEKPRDPDLIKASGVVVNHQPDVSYAKSIENVEKSKSEEVQ